MTPWYLERLDLRFPEDFRRVEQTPTEQEAEQALRQELMNRIRLQQAKQRSEIVAQQLAHIQNSDLLESVEQARIALSNWETNSGHGISCATPYHSSSLLSRESIVKSIKLQAQTGKAWQLNPELRTRNQQTALNTVLHGLAHRLASEEDGLFVELLLELARLKVARP